MVFGVLWAVFFHPRVRDRFIEEIMSLDTLGFEVDIIVSERGVLDDDDLIQWLGRAERWNEGYAYARMWSNASFVFMWIAGQRNITML